MEWIKNQPVFFGEESQCTDDENPVQLADNTDTTQFQFAIAPCEGAIQLMPDPNFEDSDSFSSSSNWGILYGLLCANGDTDSSTLTASTYQFDIDLYYQINITIESISSGGCIEVALGSTVLGQITATGTYTFYGFPTPNFYNTGLFLTPCEDGTEVCISEVTAYEVLTNIFVGLADKDNVLGAFFSYVLHPEYFSFAENTVTISVDWTALGLENNCYYICLLDPCENQQGVNYPPVISNCDFGDALHSWTAGSYWTPSGGNAIGISPVGPTFVPDRILSQDVFTYIGINNCVTIIVNSIASGSMDVLFGTVLVGTITTPGTHTFCGTPDNVTLSLRLANSTSISLASVCRKTFVQADSTCSFDSNFFKLSDYSNQCTLLINACNNEDGLGFVFTGSGFIPRIRLEAKLKQAKYPSERTIYEDSLGTQKNVFFKGRKAKNLCIDLQPEYVHDFLRLLLGFDNMYINSVAYAVVDDEYNVSYSDASDNLGSVRLLVGERTQDTRNINCSDDQNLCNLA